MRDELEGNTNKNYKAMSLTNNKTLREIAKARCRELRKNSTNAERIFWEQVRNRKFMGLKINRQFPIFYDLKGKETFFIADFYCHEKKLVIEIDCKIHENQKEQDKERTEILNLLGYTVIRFNNDEIEKNIKESLKKIEYNLKVPSLAKRRDLGMSRRGAIKATNKNQ